jgi:predicted TIM-barrel fold metal-dependent hydrolase
VNKKLVEIMDSVYDLIFYGALDRFPKLKLVIVENEIGWLPFALQQWDFYLNKNEDKSQNPPLRMMPSEYLGKQVFATFFNDAIGTRYLDSWGADACMWSNDYPHPNSTWPHSRDVIARHLGHLNDETRQKVLRDNVVRLYNLAVPSAL